MAQALITSDQVEDLIDNLNDIEYRLIGKIEDMDLNKIDELYKIIKNANAAQDKADESVVSVQKATQEMLKFIEDYNKLMEDYSKKVRENAKTLFGEISGDIDHNINRSLNEFEAKLLQRQDNQRRDIQKSLNEEIREARAIRRQTLYLNGVGIIIALGIVATMLFKG